MAGNTATLQIKVDVDNKGTVTLSQVSKSLNDVDAAARKASEGLKKLEISPSAAANIGKAETGIKNTKKSVDELAQAWVKQRQENSAATLTEQAFGQAAQLAQIRANGAAAAESQRAQQAKQAAEAARKAEAAAAAAAKMQESFGQLGIRSSQQIKAELAANKAAYDRIRTSGTASAQDISRAHTALANKTKELNAELKGTQQATGGLSDMVSGKLLPAIAGIATLGTAKQVIGMADSMAVLDSKIGLVTGSEEEQVAVLNQLYSVAQNTRSEIGPLSESFFGYANALQSTGASSQDVIQVIDLVSKSLKVSGATTSEASSFLLQFKQALGSGKFQGDEFRAMMENNVVFGKALAEALNTDITGLRAMSSAGELTTNKLAEAFPLMAEKINKSFEAIPITIDGALTQVSNAFKVVIADGNAVDGSTTQIAQQISGLAVIVQENAPAIDALFTGVVLGAQGFVRLGSFVVGTFETLAAAATASYGVIFKVGQVLEWVTDRIGITDQATKFWADNSAAALASAGDLATKAGDNYNRMTRSTADAEKAQKDYLKSLQGSSAAVLADIDAQKKREAEHAGSVQKMSKAEQKAADERAKVIDEMHKSIGGEDYYKREADKVLAHVEVLKKAGATQEQQAKYTYEKIAELSAQAWKKGETAAGEYLDQIKSTMADAAGVVASTDLSSDITADSSQLQAVAAQSKQELDALGNTTAVAGIEANASQFDAAADSSLQQAAELEATTATVEIGANTAVFDGAMQAVKNQVAAVSSGTMAVNTQSEEDLREALAVFEENPQLDPDGSSRKKYQKLLAEMPKKANWFMDAWAEAFSFAGGGYTWDGPRSGGMDGLGGRQVLLHPQETVVDHLNPDRAAIVSLYDKFVAQGGTGSGSASTQSMPSFGSSGASSISTNSQRGSGDMQVGTINVHIYEKTNYDELIREIRRRAIR